MALYTLFYTDDIGNKITPVNDCQGFEYTKVLGDVGYGQFDIPSNGQIYTATKPDRRIAVYRANTAGTLSLDFECFLRKFDYMNQDGRTMTSIQGHDWNGLLDRRVVAYYAGSSESLKTDYADDMMKEIFTENFLTNADYTGTTPPRSLAPYLSVQRDLSQGDSITKGFSWKNCLTVFQDIQATTKALGTEVFFGLVGGEFRTWIGARDRTVTTGVNPIVFSEERGNLINARLTYDWFDSKNLVIGGGQGHEESRTMSKSSTPGQIALSRFARAEKFIQSNSNNPFEIAHDVQNELKRRREKVTLSGTLLDTPLTPYGGLNGWQINDKVTVNYQGRQFDVIIRSVNVKVDNRGNETIKSRIEDAS